MIKIGWALLMLSTFSLAQGTQGTQPSQQPSQPLVQAKKVQGVKALGGNTPSPGDMYCSGFITTEKIPDNHYIVGGWNSPDQSHFAGSTDLVYIHGPELKEGDRLRFRCHTGHAFSINSLLAELTEDIEQSLWTSIRSIEESTMLMRHLASHLSTSESRETIELLRQKAQEAQQRAEAIRQVVMNHEKLSEDKAETVKA